MKEQHLAFLLHQHQQQSLHTKHYPKYNFVAAAGAAALSASLVKCVLVSQSVIDYHTQTVRQTPNQTPRKRKKRRQGYKTGSQCRHIHTHTSCIGNLSTKILGEIEKKRDRTFGTQCTSGRLWAHIASRIVSTVNAQ